MATFINLTPHDIAIYHNEDDPVALRYVKTVPPSGTEARKVGDIQWNVDDRDGVPIHRTLDHCKLDGLPEAEGDNIYIVSRLVAEAAKRRDVVCPGPLVRNEKGQPIGCRGLMNIIPKAADEPKGDLDKVIDVALEKKRQWEKNNNAAS